MKLFRISRAVALLAVAAAGLAGVRAHAVLVNVAFSGVATTVDSNLNPSINVGDAFTGTFQYDTSVAPDSSGGGNSIYLSALTDFSFNVADGGAMSQGYNPGPTGFTNIQVFNDAFNGVQNVDALHMFVGSANLSADTINGFAFQQLSIHLNSSATTAFATDTVLPTALDLSDFINRDFQLAFEDSRGNGAQAIFNIDSLDVRLAEQPVVPEPATLSLIGLGCAGAGVLRRRKAAR